MRIVLFHEISDRDCARVRKALNVEALKSKGHTVSFSNVVFPENSAALQAAAGHVVRVPVLTLSAEAGDSAGDSSGALPTIRVVTGVEEILVELERLSI